MCCNYNVIYSLTFCDLLYSIDTKLTPVRLVIINQLLDHNLVIKYCVRWQEYLMPMTIRYMQSHFRSQI